MQPNVAEKADFIIPIQRRERPSPASLSTTWGVVGKYDGNANKFMHYPPMACNSSATHLKLKRQFYHPGRVYAGHPGGFASAECILTGSAASPLLPAPNGRAPTFFSYFRSYSAPSCDFLPILPDSPTIWITWLHGLAISHVPVLESCQAAVAHPMV